MEAKRKICPTCGEEKYLWNRRVGCKECVAKTKKPIEGNKKPLKRKPLSPISDKRKKQQAAYRVLREAFLKQHPRCGVFPHLAATEIHHKNHREGERLNDTRYWMSVSREGHLHIHAHPEESYSKGWLIKG